MEIKKSFSPKLFFVMLGIALLPLVIILLYLIKIDAQIEAFDLSSNLLIFVILFMLVVFLSIIGTMWVVKPIGDRLMNYNEYAKQIAGGKFEKRIPIDIDDELGKLGKFFNILTKEFHEIKKKGVSEKLFIYETLFEKISDGVIYIDKDDKVVVFNSAVSEWFGQEQKKNSGQKINHLIKDEKLLELINKVKMGTNGDDSKVEISIKPGPKGKELVLQAIATKVLDQNKNLLGIAITLRDLTKEKEIDRMKTELVSMVAHELRSPLTSIAGFSELLLDEGISQEQAKEYADIILTESKRLGELINKFLDISRIESGKSQIHKTAVNMAEVIKSVLGMNMYLAESKGIKVKLNIPEKISPVYADREMMGEVMLNLFSNAVKYSPSGRNILINIEETETEQIVRVVDQGYGIPEDSLDKIFNKFYRVTNIEQIQDVNGSGLGLSLVKEIIQQHGGTIGVESKLNEGSTFTFTLPKINEQNAEQDYDLSYEEDALIE